MAKENVKRAYVRIYMHATDVGASNRNRNVFSHLTCTILDIRGIEEKCCTCNYGAGEVGEFSSFLPQVPFAWNLTRYTKHGNLFYDTSLDWRSNFNAWIFEFFIFTKRHKTLSSDIFRNYISSNTLNRFSKSIFTFAIARQ